MVALLDTPALVISDDYIDAIVSERQNGINANLFSSLREEWKAKVSSYHFNKGNPEIIQPWATAVKNKNTFINLYNNPKDGSTQKPVLESLRNRVLNFCPSCGEDGTPNTLDHYLPKTEFPEFSLTPENLFPMCDICQGKKGTSTVSNGNQRLFLHPYYDDFLRNQVLVLEILAPFNAPAGFTLNPASHLNPLEAQIVLRHIRELTIESRYKSYFQDQYIRLQKLIRESRDDGQSVRSNILLFKKMEKMKSINSWGHIFYDGILRNQGLMHYLEGALMPDFI